MKPVCFDCCSICILDYSVIRLSGERRKETDMVYTIIAIAVGLLETAITILFCRKKNLLFGKAVNSGVAEESESKSDSQPEDDPNENTHQAKSLDDNTEIAEEKTTDEGIDNVSVDSSDYSGLRQSVIIETERVEFCVFSNISFFIDFFNIQHRKYFWLYKAYNCNADSCYCCYYGFETEDYT